MSLNIHENIKEKLNYFHKIHKIPNILFHGPTGSGKRGQLLMNLFIKFMIMIERKLKILLCM